MIRVLILYLQGLFIALVTDTRLACLMIDVKDRKASKNEHNEEAYDSEGDLALFLKGKYLVFKDSIVVVKIWGDFWTIL